MKQICEREVLVAYSWHTTWYSTSRSSLHTLVKGVIERYYKSLPAFFVFPVTQHVVTAVVSIWALYQRNLIAQVTYRNSVIYKSSPIAIRNFQLLHLGLVNAALLIDLSFISYSSHYERPKK
jgi:hypothetical protein